MNMIVRRVSGDQRRTIRQSQGGFQEHGFLNRFLSKFRCRHKEILCIPNLHAGGMIWDHQNKNITIPVGSKPAGILMRLFGCHTNPRRPYRTNLVRSHLFIRPDTDIIISLVFEVLDGELGGLVGFNRFGHCTVGILAQGVL